MDEVPKNKVRTLPAGLGFNDSGNWTAGYDFSRKTRAPSPSKTIADNAYKAKRRMRMEHPNKKATRPWVAFIVRK